MNAPGTQIAAPEPAGRRTGARWVVALALVVMIGGAALRLAELDRNGLKGSDNTYYTNMALLWSQGDHVYSIGGGPLLYYRPVVFIVDALAVKLLGFNDTSIKLVNASLDTVNILLVFLLAYILSRRDPWVASSAAVIYALLPFTILIARSELTHVLSTTTILIATILVALAWYANNRAAHLILAFLGGAATGLSALTHEEMIFSAAAPALFLLLRPGDPTRSSRTRWFAAMISAGSFLAGVLVVAFPMLLAHQTNAQTRAAGMIELRVSQGHYLPFVARPVKFAWNALTGSSSTVFACLVICLMLVLIAVAILRAKRDWTGWRLPTPAIQDLPLWTAVAYLAIYSFFFAYYLVRLFVPLIPLVIVWWCVRSSSLLTGHVGRPASRAALVGLTVVVAAANMSHINTLRMTMSSYFQMWGPLSFADDLDPGRGWSILQRERTRTKWPKKRYLELSDVVSEDSRLLVGASSIHQIPGRRVLQVGFYFGDNAVYLIDHEQPIDRLIDDKKIGFVFFTSYQTEDWDHVRGLLGRRYLYDGRWSSIVRLIPGASLGFADGEYTLTKEFERLRSVMARRGARIILGQRDLLKRPPSGKDPFSYVVWTLDPMDWPPLVREIEATSKSLSLASEGRLKKALATLEAADTKEMHEMGRFRLRLTGVRILAEAGRSGEAARRVARAMTLLPRNTTVSTVLREAYPTAAETEAAAALFSDLQSVKPKNRSIRDLLLWLALNRTELALESGDPDETVAAFRTIEDQLRRDGSRKATSAMAKWCASTCRRLAARGGRSAELEACRAAASAAEW